MSSKYCFGSIKWLEVKKTDEYIYLLSEFAVASREYHNKNEMVFWKNSSLNGWLTTQFFSNSFSHNDKKRIEIISIPTIEQILDWFPKRQDRKCFATENAIKQGIELFSESGNTCAYWLQNTGRREGYSSTVVRACGNIYSSAFMKAKNVGVRPYIIIKGY